MALADNIVAYWKLDESSGNAADSVASNTLTNNNSVAYNAALINNGANFGTANTNKTLSSTTNSGTGHQNMSFSCWVKMNTEIASGTQGFFNIRANTTSNFIDWNCQYEYNGGTRRIGFNRSRPGVADNYTYGTVTMGTTNFYHLVMTYDTATLRGYINGTEVSNLATSGVGTGGANTITIGGYSTGSNFSSSTIDEFGIWTRALSAGEVTSLYNGGAGLAYPFSGGALVSQYLSMMGVGS